MRSAIFNIISIPTIMQDMVGGVSNRLRVATILIIMRFYDSINTETTTFGTTKNIIQNKYGVWLKVVHTTFRKLSEVAGATTKNPDLISNGEKFEKIELELEKFWGKNYLPEFEHEVVELGNHYARLLEAQVPFRNEHLKEFVELSRKSEDTCELYYLAEELSEAYDRAEDYGWCKRTASLHKEYEEVFEAWGFPKFQHVQVKRKGNKFQISIYSRRGICDWFSSWEDWTEETEALAREFAELSVQSDRCIGGGEMNILLGLVVAGDCSPEEASDAMYKLSWAQGEEEDEIWEDLGVTFE